MSDLVKVKRCSRCGAEYDIYEGDREPHSCEKCSCPYLVDAPAQLAMRIDRTRTHTRDDF